MHLKIYELKENFRHKNRKRVSKVWSAVRLRVLVLISLTITLTPMSLVASSHQMGCLDAASMLIEELHTRSSDIASEMKFTPALKGLNIGYLEKNPKVIKENLKELEREIDNIIYIQNAIKANLQSNPHHSLALLNILKRKGFVSTDNQLDVDKLARLFELKKMINILKDNNPQIFRKKINFYPETIKLKLTFKHNPKQIAETGVINLVIKTQKKTTLSVVLPDGIGREIPFEREDLNIILNEIGDFEGASDLSISSKMLRFETMAKLSKLIRESAESNVADLATLEKDAFSTITSHMNHSSKDYWDRSNLKHDLAEILQMLLVTSDRDLLLRKLDKTSLRIEEILTLVNKHERFFKKESNQGNYYHQFLRIRNMLDHEGNIDQKALHEIQEFQKEIIAIRKEIKQIQFSTRSPYLRPLKFELEYANYDINKVEKLIFEIKTIGNNHFLSVDNGRFYMMDERMAQIIKNLSLGEDGLAKIGEDGTYAKIETHLSNLPLALFEQITETIEPLYRSRLNTLKASYLLDRTYPDLLVKMGTVDKIQEISPYGLTTSEVRGFWNKIINWFFDDSLDIESDDFTFLLKYKNELIQESENQAFPITIKHSFGKTYLVIHESKILIPERLKKELLNTLLTSARVKNNQVTLSVTHLTPHMFTYLSDLPAREINSSLTEAMPYYMLYHTND